MPVPSLISNCWNLLFELREGQEAESCFLTVLEAEKSKIRLPAGLVSDEGPLFSLQAASSHYVLT